MSTPAGGPDIYIDPNGTIVTAEELQEVNNRVRQIVTDLQADIRARFTQWQGASREEYEVVQAQWEGDMNAASAALDGHTGLLMDLADGWNRTDARGTDLWRGVRG
ncbi:WXG100 family type VII secretion target [Streptomyces cadmiisoli]|uniref:WXG100 family type VII secretion target n=1 Tax=Streptomyces cadmiisoli TaxID=2184053 RepID=UPI0013A6C97C|nr:WXG100 family type VII secretion target [Streptomyces cadmiisoli]